MNKQHILEEIRRTAKENGGKPLGRERFEKETGIRYSEWAGRYWARWNDAVNEAGLSPNQMNALIDDDVVIGQLALLARKLGRFPVNMEMRMHKRVNPTFPNDKVFARFGSKADLVQAVEAYCARHTGFDDVAGFCASVPIQDGSGEDKNTEEADDLEVGYVYLALMKVGREKRYKIGKADIVERRKKQIGPHLPEDLELVHTISTDDAYGIEAYWHKRFDTKRRGGEWFALASADVKAFKRRKFM